MPDQYCSRCGQSVPEGSSLCPACGEALAQTPDSPTQTELHARAAQPHTTPQKQHQGPGARFLPGQVLSGRYRIIGLLGRGGMGEVYRADDLKLGQPVALKFLPERLSQDAALLERFFNEARVARQVTHPNVCRVHDIGEVDGQHYISMEYVDGENLAMLRRRIGRVPEEKAVQVAQQLCAGLAAAHDQGILHRDLKPANIMLDGRGRVRITDFGLAGLAEQLSGDEKAGTPAYQAPEQLAGREVSTASDIYSLGLVLYELFTGKKAFEATSIADLKRRQLETTPTSLASHVEGIDASIQRIILRCISVEPERRPSSPLAISAALPGGDPLAAALAAGETPSPEMVANAGEAGGLKVWVAVALLAATVAGIVVAYAHQTRNSAVGRAGLPRSATELGLRARQILEEIGHDGEVGDSAGALNRDRDYFQWVRSNDKSPDRWSGLDKVIPRPMYFWYRQSPNWFQVRGFSLAVSDSYPVSTAPGTVDMRLDADGRLLRLSILPEKVQPEHQTADYDWAALLESTGVDTTSLTPVRPISNPGLNCGPQHAWETTYRERPETPIRIEACSAGGRPAYLEVMPPWHPIMVALGSGSEDTASRGGNSSRYPTLIVIVVLLVIFIGGILLAHRNVRLGRADHKGSFRLAAFLFVGHFVMNMVKAHHGPIDQEVAVLLQSLAGALLIGALSWTFYTAIEPFVRRLWPQTIISWSRLLEGRFRDPLVGRDVLIGAAIASTCFLAQMGGNLTVVVADLPSGGPLGFVSGIQPWTFQMLDGLFGVVLQALALITLLVLLRILLRRDWLTGVVATAIPVTVVSIAIGDPLAILWATMIWGPVFFMAIRFGLLTLMAAAMIVNLDHMVRVWDPSSWYFPYVVAGLALYSVPVLYGFFVALRGRKLFSAEFLDG